MHPSILIFLAMYSVAASADATTNRLPEVQKIVRPYTPEFIDLARLTTADSAAFIEPQTRKVLNGQSATVSVVPTCSLDSMVIFVRHSASKTDTLARLYRSPWQAVWNYGSLPDQDQIHLQFGYRIWQPTGKVITSPSLPHQWAIDRTVSANRKKNYRCRQLNPPDSIVVDGVPSEWNRLPRAPIDTCGFFALCWTSATVMTPATLYFLAEIRGTDVLPTDIVEMHLDPYRTRTTFASEKHRSILFAPRGRSYSFVADSTGAHGYRQSDSIASLINDAVRWSARVGDSGYVIEAAIPFYTLSELKYPPRKFGADVSVRSGKGPFKFAGWANKNEYARYNPSEWGTALLQQTAFTLHMLLIAGGVIIALLAAIVLLVSLKNSAVARRFGRQEAKGGSPELHRIKSAVAERLGDPSLSVESLSVATGIEVSTITSVLRDELDSSFDRYLAFARIGAAKLKLADIRLPMDEIAQSCGYLSMEIMTRQFREYLHTGPEEFRKQIIESDDDADIPDHHHHTNHPQSRERSPGTAE